MAPVSSAHSASSADVDRLDRRHVDDAGRNVFFPENLGGAQRASHFHAAGDDGYVAAVAQDLALADFEVVIVAEQPRARAASGAHIDRAVEIEHRLGRERHFDRIGGRDHGHAGDGAERGQILQRLRRAAVGSDIEARMAGDDLHVALGVGNGEPRLFDRAQAEHGEGRDDGKQADGGDAARRRHHVLLGDAELEEAVGMRLAEMMHAGTAGDVGVQHDERADIRRETGERSAEGFAQRIAGWSRSARVN